MTVRLAAPVLAMAVVASTGCGAGLATGVGFSAVLVVLGGARELLGQGTLFAQAHLLFGDAGRAMTIDLTGGHGFLLALLPPGAFLGLGLMVAGFNVIRSRGREATPATRLATEAGT